MRKIKKSFIRIEVAIISLILIFATFICGNIWEIMLKW